MTMSYGGPPESWPLLMRPRQAANLIAVSPNIMYRLLKLGRIRAARAGTRWLISRDALWEFILGRTANGDST